MIPDEPPPPPPDLPEAFPATAPSRTSWNWQTVLTAFLPILVTLLLFSPIYQYSFTNTDDSPNIFHNPYIVPVSTQNLGYFWTHGYYELYMPITYTLWGLLARIAERPDGVAVPGGGISFLNASVYHGTSLVLHLLNVLLVYLLLRRLSFTPIACTAGALVFGIHPVQVESVAWATGMNNLTGGLFSLLAILLYVTGAQTTGSTRDGQQRLWFGAATLSFLFALFSKPTAAAVPLIVLVLELGVLRRPRHVWGRLLGTWIVLAAGWAVLTRITSNGGTSFVVSPLWGRFFIVADEYFFYLCRLIWPPAMTINYGRSIPVVLGHWWGYVTWLLPAGLGILLWRAGTRARYLQVAACLFFVGVLPTTGIIPFYGQKATNVSDRYQYLAMLGFAFLVAYLLTRYRKQTPAYLVIGALLIAFAVRSALQIPTWRDTFTFSLNAIRANPQDAAAQANYGAQLVNEGRLPEARRQLQTAIALDPSNPSNEYNLGTTLDDLGDTAASIPHLEKAVKLAPNFVVAWFRLGVEYAKMNRIPEAIAALKRNLELEPEHADAHYILGVLLANSGRPAEALPQFQVLVQQLAPRAPDAQADMGSVLDQLGRHAEAIPYYQTALRLDPNNAVAQKGLGKIPSSNEKK